MNWDRHRGGEANWGDSLAERPVMSEPFSTY